MEQDDFTCSYCEAEFKIAHNHINEPAYCPFCGTELEHDDEGDDAEREWE